MINGDVGSEDVGVKGSLAGVGVAIIDGEIAALDVYSQALTRLECGSTIADVDLEAVNFAGVNGYPV